MLKLNTLVKLNTAVSWVLTTQLTAVFEPPNLKPFEKSTLSPHLGLQILPLFEDSKIDLDVVDDTTVTDTPPWSQSEPQICLSLKKYKKRFYKP